MSTIIESSAVQHGDMELARRLESTEGATNAAFVSARAAQEPGSGATWTLLAGVYAMYDGGESPLTQTFGLGIFDPIGEREIARLEQFFTDRAVSVQHEVSPFVSPETQQLLIDRGYRPVEYSTVLARSTALPPPTSSPIVVREIDHAERGTWSRVAGEGWSSESEELASFIEAFGQVITRAEGVHCFLADQAGRPIAAAAMSLNGGIALLAGASTIPSARRRGAQQALLEHRLRFAHEQGADLAMVVTAPGSASQRNAERQGFRVAYTRTKWKLYGRAT